MKRWLKLSCIVLALGSVLTLALITISPEWDNKVIIACVFYALIVSVFLAAQIFGFVASHVSYSDYIEEPKFQMLEQEEREWAKS